MLACETNNYDICKDLFDNGYFTEEYLQKTDNNGLTALQIAKNNNYKEIVDLVENVIEILPGGNKYENALFEWNSRNN